MSETNPRVADYPVDSQFIGRWSPRAFTGEKIPESELRSHVRGGALGAVVIQFAAVALFLCFARHAGVRHVSRPADDSGNQVWAKNAGALAYPRLQNDEPSGRKRQAGDRRAAIPSTRARPGLILRLRRSGCGWATHAMGGFDVARTRPALNLPEDYPARSGYRRRPQGRSEHFAGESAQRAKIRDGRKPQSEFTFQGRLSPA